MEKISIKVKVNPKNILEHIDDSDIIYYLKNNGNCSLKDILWFYFDGIDNKNSNEELLNLVKNELENNEI